MKNRIRSCMQQVLKATEVGLLNSSRSATYTSFLKSILSYIDSRNLTPAQARYFEKIEKSCEPEMIAEHASWINKYDTKLREVAIICAEYYAHSTDYYHYISQKVLSDREGHVLTKAEFNKMCANKYAHSVIESWTSKPKYHTGQLIQVRKSNRLDMYKDRWGNRISNQYKTHKRAMGGEDVTAVVIESNAGPVYRAVKGGKVYKILPFGETEPVFACEKDIKNCRK